MSRHNRQQSKRHRASLKKADPERVRLAMARFERTGRFPSYSTPLERLEAIRRLRLDGMNLSRK